LSFVIKRDVGRCRICGLPIVEGDDVEADDDEYKHARCSQDVKDGHIVEWRYADSVSRADWEEREQERIAPLGKQGKCSVCFVELPLTGICDEHGRA
jgi:hypothetical protein